MAGCICTPNQLLSKSNFIYVHNKEIPQEISENPQLFKEVNQREPNPWWNFQYHQRTGY